jgi:hypothetical protein
MGRSGDPRKRASKPVNDAVITIVGGRDADAPTDCLISWQGHDWTAGVEHVRATAVDLFTAASWAELMMLMVTKVGVAPTSMGAMAGDLIRLSGRSGFGNEETVTLLPVGSSKAGEALVLIRRRHLQGVVDTGTARQMGLAWLTTAEAAESDQLVTEALRTAGGLSADAIEGLFAYLRELRSKEANHG